MSDSGRVGGCFPFWAWLRLDRSAVRLLTFTDAEHAGRTWAAYGGVYITASTFWLRTVEGAKPDRSDLIGDSFCLTGAAIILFGPRHA